MATVGNLDEMSKPLRVFVLLVVVASILLGIAVIGYRSSNRSALEKYKAELRAKGEKLTFAEVLPPPSSTVSASLVKFTNAMGSLAYSRLSPGSLELRKVVGPAKAQVLWKQEKPFGTGSGKGGLAADWPEFTTNLVNYRQSLEELQDSLKDPALNWSARTSVWDQPLPNFVTIRLAAQWLSASTIGDLHEGRTEQALEDLEAMTALARLNRDECTLVSQMIRVAVAGLGMAATWEALQAPDWTEPQLARLQKAWESVGLESALENGCAGERAAGDELWRVMRHESRRELRKRLSFGVSTNMTFQVLAQDYVLLPLYKLTSMDADELFRLRIMQGYIDTARAVRAHRPWSEAKQAQDRGVAELSRISASPVAPRYWLSMISIPNFMRANQTGVRGETEWQMTLAAIALKRFQLRHGEYPPNLEALTPEFLPAVPYDCFSGKPLCYQLKSDGTFLLYSVGDDGKNNGGDATAVGKFGLWEGQDAVWPQVDK